MKKKYIRNINPSEKSHLKLLKSIAFFQNLNSHFPIEGILSEKGPSYQHNKKCMENIVENMHVDVNVKGAVPWILSRKF